MALCIDAAGAVERSYFEPGPIDVERDGQAARVYTRGVGEVFTELGRAGSGSTPCSSPGPTRRVRASRDDRLARAQGRRLINRSCCARPRGVPASGSAPLAARVLA